MRNAAIQDISHTSPSAPSVVGALGANLARLGIPLLLPENERGTHIEEGRLMRVLEDWCPPFAGYHLYYPSRRQPSPAFSLVLKALRLDARKG